MRKVDDGKRKKEKRENNFVFSGHSRHCQSAPRTPTDWNAARSCQLLTNTDFLKNTDIPTKIIPIICLALVVSKANVDYIYICFLEFVRFILIFVRLTKIFFSN